MENLPDMDKYTSPLKITFVDGRVWEGAKLDGVYYVGNYSYVPEDDNEDELFVTYQGMGYSIKASRIQTIESQAKHD
ncbi:hypothetical protein [Helicobacter suis]|uniref:hypothetical protein n=1 Tax=Helicobacter suis TaxID=104628 RepID=UPI0013D6269E|nr:hypothetical protein [Helicobacter suis]